MFKLIAPVVVLLLFSTYSQSNSVCSQSSNITDLSYCQFANQLNLPARWMDKVLTNSTAESSQIQAVLLQGWDIYSDYSINRITSFKTTWVVPELEKKLRINFSASKTQSDEINTTPEIQSKTTNASLMSAYRTDLLRFQLGLGVTGDNEVILLSQASLPLVKKLGKYSLGSTQRVKLNPLIGPVWVNSIFLDYQRSNNTLVGLDNTWVFTQETQIRTNTSTLRTSTQINEWEAKSTWAAQYVYSKEAELINYWISVSGSHKVGRPWATVQLAPEISWNETDHYQPKKKISLNLIFSIAQ